MSNQKNPLNYVRGTFTPALQFSAGSTGITYAARSGFYIKIGEVVQYSLQMQLTSKGTDVGNLSITGLPFNNGPTSAVGEIVAGNLILDPSFNTFKPFINPTINLILIFQEGNNSTLELCDDTNVNDNSLFTIAGSYVI